MKRLILLCVALAFVWSLIFDELGRMRAEAQRAFGWAKTRTERNINWGRR